jgi:hypothetical protein
MSNKSTATVATMGIDIALRYLRGPVSLTGGQSQASIFNDLGAWLQCAMEGEMVNQPTAKDRLIHRRGVLRTVAALAPARSPALAKKPVRLSEGVTWSAAQAAKHRCAKEPAAEASAVAKSGCSVGK